MSLPLLVRASLSLLIVFLMFSSASAVEMKTVQVDDFFAGQLQPLPLKWKIPAAYVFAKGLEVDETYSYWMLPEEVKPAIVSKDLPANTGYVWGKLSIDVGYFKEEKKFSHEDDYKQQMEEKGWKFITEKKRDVSGFALIASTFAYNPDDAATRRLIFSAYIATNIDTNCIFLAYSAPKNLTEVEAQKVWDTIIDSIEKD